MNLRSVPSRQGCTLIICAASDPASILAILSRSPVGRTSGAAMAAHTGLPRLIAHTTTSTPRRTSTYHPVSLAHATAGHAVGLVVVASSHGRSHRAYREARQRLKDEAPWLCWLCGQPISRMPFPHPQSWTADHVVPLAEGGAPDDVTNLRPAHLPVLQFPGRRGADQRQGTAAQDLTGVVRASLGAVTAVTVVTSQVGATPVV